jgi:tripeptide aminopeptidase
MFPVLHQLLGQTLITTDGKTLLGADDKAGIAEIMTALAVLKGKNIPHGDIRVAFTPDEEVGKGAKHFDVDAFNAQWAYTVTAAAWVSWSMKTSTPRRSPSKLWATTFIPALQKG